MLQKRLLICITCSFQTFLFAQSNVVTTGKDANGSNGSVSYTIGQIDYTNQQASSGKVNQGVQQPYEIYQTSGMENLDAVSVTIGPNPTFGTLVIHAKNTNTSAVDAILYDSNGKLVYNQSLLDVDTEIDLTSFAGGMYTLQIFQAKTPISSFKIVKN